MCFIISFLLRLPASPLVLRISPCSGGCALSTSWFGWCGELCGVWQLSLDPLLCSFRGLFRCVSSSVRGLCVLELDKKVISEMFLDAHIIKTCSSGTLTYTGLKVSYSMRFILLRQATCADSDGSFVWALSWLYLPLLS
ncbi:hypothetical protein F2Q70_00008962 [Brassica cretica]|uniref:Secreted protein n=1 Tax=Brassica cretica TaxID=69181 RepID=A0A8S9LNK8_BRACR|nr:hypothetical protein F2Q68_00002020 [Brassica cretica]KAF2609600.1 hypothetical protein F2Q70_00008962 [Brassica cretica]